LIAAVALLSFRTGWIAGLDRLWVGRRVVVQVPANS
jgi:hypothetical protein